MRKDLDSKLVAAHPDLFRDRDGDMRETAMCWGFQCGDGWYNLLDDLATDIDRIAERTGVEVRANTVKEKFGTLRFYIFGGNNEIDNVIQWAENKSAHICEECGEPGELRRIGYWYYTSCEKHKRKEKKA